MLLLLVSTCRVSCILHTALLLQPCRSCTWYRVLYLSLSKSSSSHLRARLFPYPEEHMESSVQNIGYRKQLTPMQSWFLLETLCSLPCFESRSCFVMVPWAILLKEMPPLRLSLILYSQKAIYMLSTCLQYACMHNIHTYKALFEMPLLLCHHHPNYKYCNFSK